MIGDDHGPAAPDQQTAADRRAARELSDFLVYGYVPLTRREGPGWPPIPLTPVRPEGHE